MRLNPYLVKSTMVAALGGLLFGFDIAVISGTTAALTDTFHLSRALLGLTGFECSLGNRGWSNAGRISPANGSGGEIVSEFWQFST
jgi:hypothetical protein